MFIMFHFKVDLHITVIYLAINTIILQQSTRHTIKYSRIILLTLRSECLHYDVLGMTLTLNGFGVLVRERFAYFRSGDPLFDG